MNPILKTSAAFAAAVMLCLSAQAADPDDAAAPPKPAANPKPAPTDNAENTRQLVRELLTEAWGAVPAKAKQAGSNAQRRAPRLNANMGQITYAYGLLLLRHGDFRTAATTLGRYVKAQPEDPRGHLALALAQLHDGKGDAGLRAILEAAQQDPHDEATYTTVASVVTFLSDKPLEKMKRGRLDELQTAVFPKLETAEQTRYRAQVEQTKQYLAGLPKLRESMSEKLHMIEAEMVKVELEGRKADAERLKVQREHQIVTEQFVLLERDALANDRQYQVMIAAAQQAMNQQEVARLQAARQIDQQRYANDLAIIRGNLLRLEQRFRELQAAVNKLTQIFRDMEQQAKAERKRIDDLLAVPPFSFTVDSERDRILHELKQAEVAGLATPAPAQAPPKGAAAPPAANAAGVPVDDVAEQRAEDILKNGNVLLGIDKKEKAAEYFRRILKEYPNTSAAVQAKKALENLTD